MAACDSKNNTELFHCYIISIFLCKKNKVLTADSLIYALGINWMPSHSHIYIIPLHGLQTIELNVKPGQDLINAA